MADETSAEERRWAWLICQSRCPNHRDFKRCNGLSCGWAGKCNYGPPTQADFAAAKVVLEELQNA